MQAIHTQPFTQISLIAAADRGQLIIAACDRVKLIHCRVLGKAKQSATNRVNVASTAAEAEDLPWLSLR